MTGALWPFAFGIAACGATLLGGLLALRFERRATLILGLTAGIVLGVALFDLIPEALALGAGTFTARAVLAGVGIGFGAYMLTDRLLANSREGGWRWRAHLGPASLMLHSFLDGMVIGLAFQVSANIGWLVALAVLTHDLADGVNTVSLCLATGNRQIARRWLLADATAPLFGVTFGQFVPVPAPMLVPLMAVFAGTFLYIGACQLAPSSYALHPRLRTSLASIAGMALMYGVTLWSS